MYEKTVLLVMYLVFPFPIIVPPGLHLHLNCYFYVVMNSDNCTFLVPGNWFKCTIMVLPHAQKSSSSLWTVCVKTLPCECVYIEVCLLNFGNNSKIAENKYLMSRSWAIIYVYFTWYQVYDLRMLVCGWKR